MEPRFSQQWAVTKAVTMSKNQSRETWVVVKVHDEYDGCPQDFLNHVYLGAKVLYTLQDGKMTKVHSTI